MYMYNNIRVFGLCVCLNTILSSRCDVSVCRTGHPHTNRGVGVALYVKSQVRVKHCQPTGSFFGDLCVLLPFRETNADGETLMYESIWTNLCRRMPSSGPQMGLVHYFACPGLSGDAHLCMRPRGVTIILSTKSKCVARKACPLISELVGGVFFEVFSSNFCRYIRTFGHRN